MAAKIKGAPGFSVDQIALWVAQVTNGKTSLMGLILAVGGLLVFIGIGIDYLPSSWTELGASLCISGVSIFFTGAKHKLQKFEASEKHE